MARPSNTEERRHRIVQGLVAAMARHGYEGATIQLIAKAAGLSSGLIHYHFASKQEILLGLFEHLATLVERRRQLFAVAGGDARMQLKALIDAYLAPGPGADPQAVAAWVALGTEAIRQKEIGILYQQEIRARKARIQALLEKIAGRNRTARAGAEKKAAAIVALTEGAFQIAAAARGALPKGYAASAAKRLIDA